MDETTGSGCRCAGSLTGLILEKSQQGQQHGWRDGWRWRVGYLWHGCTRRFLVLQQEQQQSGIGIHHQVESLPMTFEKLRLIESMVAAATAITASPTVTRAVLVRSFL